MKYPYKYKKPIVETNIAKFKKILENKKQIEEKIIDNSNNVLEKNKYLKI